MAENRNENQIQNIFLENRKKMSISGVKEVANFNEEMITMFTTLGQLTIKGKNMHISRLSVETGDVEIQGEVCALGYSDNLSKKSSLISKLFR